MKKIGTGIGDEVLVSLSLSEWRALERLAVTAGAPDYSGMSTEFDIESWLGAVYSFITHVQNLEKAMDMLEMVKVFQLRRIAKIQRERGDYEAEKETLQELEVIKDG